MIKPRLSVPGMDLPLVGGGRFSLFAETPSGFTLIAAYRGFHCPICKSYLRELNDTSEAFANVGTGVVAVSCDGVERATQAKDEWKLENLRVAYDLPVELGRKWGLFVSRGISDKEPPQFVEPGLFLVRPDRTLYAASIQTMPFARPPVAEVLGALAFVVRHNYPARGEA